MPPWSTVGRRPVLQGVRLRAALVLLLMPATTVGINGWHPATPSQRRESILGRARSNVLPMYTGSNTPSPRQVQAPRGGLRAARAPAPAPQEEKWEHALWERQTARLTARNHELEEEVLQLRAQREELRRKVAELEWTREDAPAREAPQQPHTPLQQHAADPAPTQEEEASARGGTHWYERLVPKEAVSHFAGLTIVPEPPAALGHSEAHGAELWEPTHPFNVTWTMLQRSRLLQGNPHRLRRVLRQMVDERKCLKVLVLGGSISAGYLIGGPAYHAVLIEWLNAKYPCVDPATGQPGRHSPVKVDNHMGTGDSTNHLGGSSSLTHVRMMDTYNRLAERVELVLVETAINDCWCMEAGEDIGRDPGLGLQDCAEWITEVLLRKLLLLRKPEPAAVLYVDAFWRGHLFAKLKRIPMGKPGSSARHPAPHTAADQLGQLRRMMPAWGRTGVLQYYDIPVVSTFHVLFQLSMRNTSSHFMDDMYSFISLGADMWGHPNILVHRFIALALAHTLQAEVDLRHVPLSAPERDPSTAALDESDVSGLRPRLLMSAAEEDRLVRSVTLDEVNLMLGPPPPDIIVANNGWRWYADSKNKTGLIATRYGAHVALRLLLRREAVAEGANQSSVHISVGYLKTHANFSSAALWVDESRDLGCPQKECAMWNCSCALWRTFLQKLQRDKYSVPLFVSSWGPDSKCGNARGAPANQLPQIPYYQVIDPLPADHVTERSAEIHRVSVYSSLALDPRAVHTRAREGFLHLCVVRRELGPNAPAHEVENMNKARRAKFKLLSLLVSQPFQSAEQ